MPTSKNASLLRSLVSEAESLASRTSKAGFPVLLRPIAERRRVTSVDFCPLLVDAVLTTHKRGFRILLNSDGRRAQDLKELYNNETKVKMLHPRLRFSIAHELAHTLFYDLSDTSPQLSKKFSSGGGRTELENLERHCNSIASHFLLPTEMLKIEFLQLNAIIPDSIAYLARKTGVSLHALLLRLNNSDSLFVKKYFRGCIVLADEHENGLKIRAIAKPKSINIARELHLMRPGEIWKVKASNGCQINPLLLPPTSEAELDVVTQQTKCRKQYKVHVDKLGRFEGAISYLATFEEC